MIVLLAKISDDMSKNQRCRGTGTTRVEIRRARPWSEGKDGRPNLDSGDGRSRRGCGIPFVGSEERFGRAYLKR
jgi:hypothetical protein